MNIQSLIRENIKRLKPYSTARDEFQGKAEVYLDANENPFPSSYNRYPDPLQKELKQKIAELKGIPQDQIFLGNGSDEAIDLLIRSFCEPGRDSILITPPTYGMYAVCAGVNNVTVQTAPLTTDFDIDLESVYSKLDDSAKLIFFCSPNNPSGNLLSKSKIAEIIERFKGLVVIDEAYIDFADDPGFLPEINLYPNLVILQTLSKAWGLAGLRLGMAFASAEIISILNKIKYPYNISAATQELVLQKLNDVDDKNRQVKEILKARSTLSEQLKDISFVEHIYPSDSNFLLVRMEQAKQVYQYLIDQQIIVRDRSSVIRCDNCLRITVGTPLENTRLIQALNEFKP